MGRSLLALFLLLVIIGASATQRTAAPLTRDTTQTAVRTATPQAPDIKSKVLVNPSEANKERLNLFKWGKQSTTKPEGWKDGDFMLYLPDKGSPKANWKQNSGYLREQMRKENPIYDSYRDPKTGQQIRTGGFLNAERKLLESRGWKYDPSSGAYHSPGS